MQGPPPPRFDFSVSRSLTFESSAHYCTPTTGISISLAQKAFWKTGIMVTGMRPNLARTKELIHSRNARRRVKKTIPVFSGTGEEGTKRNAFSRDRLGMEKRDSRNKKTTSGWISNLAGSRIDSMHFAKKGSAKWWNGLGQALHECFEHLMSTKKELYTRWRDAWTFTIGWILLYRIDINRGM